MSLVAIDGMPLVPFGAAGRNGLPITAGGGNIVLDATKEAFIMIGRVKTEDGASHTIDTTGSSSLGWLSGTLTFANAGTTVKVGLAAVTTAAGPPGRAANASDVITFDVSKTLTGGGGGITASAWQEHVPDTGTKTIADGDLVAFAVQMTAAAGADVVRPGANTNITQALGNMPYVTEYTGGSYGTANAFIPNGVITFSDGTFGFFAGAYVYLTGQSTQTWNSGSATKEYGNFFQFPFPVNIYGLIHGAGLAGATDLILYTDPLGTPAAQKTVSVDLHTVGSATVNRPSYTVFASPYSLAASTPCAAIAKPTSATNITMNYKTYNIAGHQKSEPFGANGYAINRASGAFAAQNSNKDRYAIGLLVGAWDNATGGAGGAMGARIFSRF
jgi:hypothetical protein